GAAGGLLVRERSVDVGGVEVVHPELERPRDHVARVVLLPAEVPPVHRHAAEPDAADLDATASQWSSFHRPDATRGPVQRGVAAADTGHMATIAALLPRARARTRRVRLGACMLTAVLCAAAATFYGWMRLPVAHEQLQAFRTMCTRIQMAPSDWPCVISSTRVLWSQVGSSLLTFLAIPLPGA